MEASRGAYGLPEDPVEPFLQYLVACGIFASYNNWKSFLRLLDKLRATIEGWWNERKRQPHDEWVLCVNPADFNGGRSHFGEYVEVLIKGGILLKRPIGTATYVDSPLKVYGVYAPVLAGWHQAFSVTEEWHADLGQKVDKSLFPMSMDDECRQALYMLAKESHLVRQSEVAAKSQEA